MLGGRERCYSGTDLGFGVGVDRDRFGVWVCWWLWAFTLLAKERPAVGVVVAFGFLEQSHGESTEYKLFESIMYIIQRDKRRKTGEKRKMDKIGQMEFRRFRQKEIVDGAVRQR